MKTGLKIMLVFIPNLIFGQINLIPPVDTAQVFLPNVVSSTNHEHSSPSINTDRNLICWSMWKRPKPENPRQIIKVLDYTSAKVPQTVDFSDNYSDGGPIWSGPDKIIFYSKRPVDNRSDELVNDLWICEKVNEEWTEPYCLEFSEYTGFAVSPSLTKSGTLYFVGYADGVENNMGIYCSKPGSSGYEKPKLLPSQINSKYFDWTPFIADDESYLIFSSNRPGSNDTYGDLYISFKDDNDIWTTPVNLGDKVNTNRQERFPGVAGDLGILFFTRATDSCYDDVFWIDSKIIDEVRE
uniref:hypothetical protein n=1 Tax=uncultured Draconibacterium sp. TaxID=1573823 RepID=UPI003217C0E5